MYVPAHGLQFGFAIDLIAFFADAIEASEFGFVVDAEAADLREAALLELAAGSWHRAQSGKTGN